MAPFRLKSTRVGLPAMVVLLLGACGGDDPSPVAGSSTSTTGGPVPTLGVATTTVPPDTGSSTTSTTAPTAAGVVLTPSGLGPLRLGVSEAAATDTGFVGAIGPGCELSGTRSAPLSAPPAADDIQGSTDFADGALGVVTVTGGATTEEGTAVGDSLAAVEATYATGATVDVDRGVEDVFGVWLVTVIGDDGGVYQTVVDPTTESVTSMAVPGVAFCE